MAISLNDLLILGANTMDVSTDINKRHDMYNDLKDVERFLKEVVTRLPRLREILMQTPRFGFYLRDLKPSLELWIATDITDRHLVLQEPAPVKSIDVIEFDKMTKDIRVMSAYDIVKDYSVGSFFGWVETAYNEYLTNSANILADRAQRKEAAAKAAEHKPT